MPNPNLVIEVVAAMMLHQGKLFIARRHPNGSQGGLWEFPGGKIDKGESPEQALARELTEELSINAAVDRHIASNLHHYGDKSVNLHGYLCYWQGDPIQLTGSHDSYQWLSPAEIDRNLLAPADIPLLDALIVDLARESKTS